jgi:hypothetical protein
VQELEKRYQSFRQYVQTAHDKGQHVPLRKLARSFTSEQQKHAQAASAPQRSVEGADADFDTLIEEAKRCVLADFKASAAVLQLAVCQQYRLPCFDDAELKIQSCLCKQSIQFWLYFEATIFTQYLFVCNDEACI